MILSVLFGNSDASASVVVASSQSTTLRKVTATVSDVTIGSFGATSANNSSVSISGNSVGATAIGNRSFNSIGQ